MKSLGNALFHLAAALALACACGSVYAAVAGHVQFVYGTVQLTTGTGKAHAIQKGDAVSEGDTLTTAATASAQISMEDGGFIAVRPDTSLKFDSFRFAGKQDGNEQSFFSLFKGGFRAITGLIGKINKANYRITTPSATLGIRGTDHEILVVAPGSAMALLAPVGTYDKVNLGETTLTTGKGTLSILPNQMGYAGAADQMPHLQPLNLKIFTVAPAPQAKGGVDDQDIRDNAVVDNVLQGSLPGGALSLNTGVMQGQGLVVGSMANTNFILQPITATVTTTTPSLSVTGQPITTTTTKILSLF
ncbi:MAG: iron dicitrate transport regulator FecR [Candidatus Gallionella acididurans]|uniref:Iron dicitrate transport regulator FecR n=1 Tax=Candidatus Gallionella acididurans TaxID=1796491 RepID=A0A139BY64_9PROT|nr:MAG: iron dicitrate transport regulator FecR [Candidatus Gallionella acididurans]